MKKVIFTNSVFYVLLISFIVILLIYNAFMSIEGSNVYGLIPIFIQIVLLTLIFTKSGYARTSIMIWGIVFLIIASGFELVADLMDVFNDGYNKLKIDSFLYNLISLVIGILIVDYTKRTVILISPDTVSDQD